MQCGLLGEKLGHSYSPQIHAYFANYSYSLFEKSAQEVSDFLQSGVFTGLNVTIPYKKAVIPYCNELSDCAKRLGAVNTIVRRADGTLIGHNTDYFGFRSMVEKSGLNVLGKKVLILGSGGAAATVFAVLQELGALPIIISRTGENNYRNIHLHTDAAALVNATPVGMYPNTGISPVDIDLFPKLEGVLDLIYNPARSQLLMDAERKGLIACNGLWMLVAQAKESAEWFLGRTLPVALIADVYKKLRKQMENTVLIGMPGCGKSTIGRLLAAKNGKTFVDVDEMIIQKAGKSIPEIFSNNGEAFFRDLETQVLEELGRKSGLVIATGGGCVTQQRNDSLLHQNGTVIWLKRDISALPTDGRPLSQSMQLQEMYRIRKPLYEQFADVSVVNNIAPEEVVKQIMALEDRI